MPSQSKVTDITESFDTGATDQIGCANEPMTDEQAAVLKELCEQAYEPQEFDGELTQAEARDFIKEMRRRISQQH